MYSTNANDLNDFDLNENLNSKKSNIQTPICENLWGTGWGGGGK